MTAPAFVIRRARLEDLRPGRPPRRAPPPHSPRSRSRALHGPAAKLEEGYAWFLGTQLERDDALVLVAEQGGAVVGYAWATIEPLSWKELREEAGFIQDVCVDEPARGAGIASALLEEAARWLAGRGVPRVMLWTAARNETARRLFTRLGFRETMVEMTREVPRQGSRPIEAATATCDLPCHTDAR